MFNFSAGSNSGGNSDGAKKKFIGGAERARRQARKPKRPPSFSAYHNNYKSNSNNKSNNKRNNNHENGRQRWKRPKPQSFQLALPSSLKPSERFLGSLCLCTIEDFVSSNRSVEDRDYILAQICGRAKVGLPTAIPSSNQTAYDFYRTRASLVLEEARAVLSDALQRLSSQSSRKKSSVAAGIPVKLVDAQEGRKTTNVILTFDASRLRDGCFAPQNVYEMRPGSIYLIHIPSTSATDSVAGSGKIRKCQTTLLSCVVPHFRGGRDVDTVGTNGGSAGNGSIDQVRLMIFPTDSFSDAVLQLEHENEWRMEHVVTLISHVRQFEACIKAPSVAFLPNLLVLKRSTHTRFYSDSEEEIVGEVAVSGADDDEDGGSGHGDDDSNDDGDVDDSSDGKAAATTLKALTKQRKLKECFTLPALNATQQRAMNNFIHSPDSTLSLVQGPPGTGKTTFLVSTLSNMIIHNQSQNDRTLHHRRILVTAPTNKAITVLASRFLESMAHDAPVSVVLIGVEDKLVDDGDDDEDRAGASRSRTPKQRGKGKSTDKLQMAGRKQSSGLRRIFVYSWMDTLKDDCAALKKKLLASKHDTWEEAYRQTADLHTRITRGIPYEAKTSGLRKATATLASLVQNYSDVACDPSPQQRMSQLKDAFGTIETALRRIDPSAAISDLLASAKVIFCTLSTAGVSLMKSTVHVHDLLIDEAAAATEAELCIPFHLRPKRMLAVGDPMQLPALVVSDYASKLGLSKSMHQRLMVDCDADHIMLDVQYRMKPGISQFPSGQFYHGSLMNGPNVVDSTAHRSPLGDRLFDGRPYTFLQCDGEETQNFGASYSNLTEAKLVVSIVQQIQKASSASAASSRGKHAVWCSSNRLRIITFYQGQVGLIKRELNKNGIRDVLVATVDSSQGCEADTVLVSFTRSNNAPAGNVRRCAGFLDDARRINVAITRAKYQLICIGNARHTLRDSGSRTLKALVDDAEGRGCILQM